MSAIEAAGKLGKGVTAAYSWAHRANVKWARPSVTRSGASSTGAAPAKKKKKAGAGRAKSDRAAILDELTPQEAKDCDLLYRVMRYGWPRRLRSIKRHDLADRWEALPAQPKGGV